MTLATLLAVLVVVVAVPLNWFATVYLWRRSRERPDLHVLRERAFVAFVLSLIVTMFALIFVNNELEFPPLDREATMILSRSALLALSIIPSAYFLWRYR